MVQVDLADRIKQLPPYLFVKLDQMKAEARANGVDVIDFGIGDPDQPTPGHIIQAAKSALDNPENHRYPSSYGMESFRKTVADWMHARFGVGIEPGNVVNLIGSKEGVAHLPLAYINPGNLALVPSPAYPVYTIGTQFAGGLVHYMPLLDKNDFLPDLEAIPEEAARAAKIMFINYPNNPTSAVAGLEFFERVIAFAKKYEILICHDAAYTEVAFDGFKPPSILEVPGAMDYAIELHSHSKTYNMTGWRIGFAVGNPDAVAALGKVKSNIDSGAFQVAQEAAIEAMRNGDKDVVEMAAKYQARRDALLPALDSMGIEYLKPKASFYVWAKTPQGMSSADWVARLLKEAGIMCSPGNGYGPEGEGFFRMALIVPEARIKEAVERMRKLKL